MDLKTVCVLMSTYNGEKYIKEQIESILNQKDIKVKLYVRDDGSTDKTVDILKSYEHIRSLEILGSIQNIGPAKSFMELLYSVDEYEYYSFADQDDIWKEDKIITAIQAIENKAEKGVPVLYGSNQILFIKNNEQGLRFNKIPNITLTGVICGNLISGCTMVFNNELKKILVNPQNRPSDEVLKIRMHDTWILAVATICGEFIYDSGSYINYRIHDNNTIGIKDQKFLNRFKKFFHKIKTSNFRYGRSKLAINLMKIEAKNINQRDVIEAFAFSRENKIRLIQNKTIKKDCNEKRLIFLFKVLIGWI